VNPSFFSSDTHFNDVRSRCTAGDGRLLQETYGRGCKLSEGGRSANALKRRSFIQNHVHFYSLGTHCPSKEKSGKGVNHAAEGHDELVTSTFFKLTGKQPIPFDKVLEANKSILTQFN
jgi:hypothetical protein